MHQRPLNGVVQTSARSFGKRTGVSERTRLTVVTLVHQHTPLSEQNSKVANMAYRCTTCACTVLYMALRTSSQPAVHFLRHLPSPLPSRILPRQPTNIK